MKCFYLKAALFMGAVVSVPTQAATYIVPFDSVKWQGIKKSNYCELFSQDDKAGLKVSFIIRGAEPMRLSISGRSAGAFQEGLAMSSDLPSWGLESNYATTSLTDISRTKNGLVLNKGADLIYQDLVQGACFIVSDLFHSVTFPTANIAQALDVFQQCTSTLPPAYFDQNAVKIQMHGQAVAATAQSNDSTKTGQTNANAVFHFKSGQSSLNQAQLAQLEQISQQVMEDPAIKTVFVDGHTDSKGTAASNKAVSQRRADDAAYWMVMQGVPESKIQARGQGAKYPIDSNDTEAGRNNNRRIEVRLVR